MQLFSKMGKRLVIALGGNALGNTPEQQLELVKNTAAAIVDLVEEGYDVVIGHGNGPQVGMVNLAFEYSSGNNAGTPSMPFPECGAMTQGYIGYHLQQSISRELAKRGIQRSCAAVITQVEVDPDDPAFEKPTKPIGLFYDKDQAEKIVSETGYVFVEDSGRGYRRVVPSPKPVSIVEIDVVRKLTAAHDIVITVGGGGIPVVSDDDGYSGVAAVIDKDWACSRLADELNADILLILTAVEKVSINFRKENEKKLDHMSLKEAERYVSEGHFAAGSMLPKVQACMEFVKNSTERKAIITSLSKAREALRGLTGTIIEKELI